MRSDGTLYPHEARHLAAFHARYQTESKGDPTMQSWKSLETTTIYLANGEEACASVNGISPDDGSGFAMIQGRKIKVGPLPDSWSALGYGEIVPIVLQSGETITALLTPDDYLKHVAYLYRDNDSIEATICVYDQGRGGWREMTDQEYEQERLAWEADAKDMAQIKRGWREYRDEGLGERGEVDMAELTQAQLMTAVSRARRFYERLAGKQPTVKQVQDLLAICGIHETATLIKLAGDDVRDIATRGERAARRK